MSSRPEIERSVEELISDFQRLASQRYPTMLVVYGNRSQLPLDRIREIASAVGARFIDMIIEASTGGVPISAGAFRRHHFLAWLRERAVHTGAIWVDNADSVMTTWPREEQSAFLREFLRTESRCADDDDKPAPIVLMSRLAAEHKLPLEARGQGLVIYLEGGR